MGKVHPQEVYSSASSSSYFTSKQETFTIWMKSLILSGKGCTVFDSNGQIVYRVDNYDCKCSNEVYLMDSRGKVLFTILRKKLMFLSLWEGHTSTTDEVNMKKPGFQVRKAFRILKSDSLFEVKVGLDQNQLNFYKMESWTSKSVCKIVDKFGGLVAEVKRKRSACGVVLGEDVLTMVVAPFTDHSLIMGLVVVCSLINCKM